MQNMQVQFFRCNHPTKYHYHAFGVNPVKINYDYSKDFRDRLRKAQQWNRGNSLIYSLR